MTSQTGNNAPGNTTGTAPGTGAGEGSGERGRWEQRLNDAGTRVEEELRRIVRYIDDEVVPEIRRNGSAALRQASAELERLAKTMDDRRGGGPAGKP